MRVYLQKRLDGNLAPACETSARLNRRLAPGEVIEADWKSRNGRSVAWHRRYFALCTLIYQNCERITVGDTSIDLPSVEAVHMTLKGLAGLYDAMLTLPDGTRVALVKSIAFDKMTADEWAEAWPRLLDVVHDKILPGVEISEVEEEIARLAA